MKKLFVLLTAMIMAVVTSAQVREVTLTVLGSGRTEEEATLQALRSAIEQTFGTFVSAETKILNDRLVQDEIVSVSNGNVKQYQKLNVAVLPNQQVSVSLSATISINKLVAFAQSKGSRAEFAGATFATNFRLMQLRSSSTQKALQHMMDQLNIIARQMFDYKIEIGESSFCKCNIYGEVYSFPTRLVVYSNANSSQFYDLLNSTLDNLRLNSADEAFCKQAGIQVSNLYNRRLPISQNTCDRMKLAIEDAIDNALLYRYEIREVSNRSHKFQIKKEERRAYKVSCGNNPQGMSAEMKSEHNKAYWSFCSSTWPKNLRVYYSGKPFYSPSDYLTPSLHMTEVRTPIKLSKEQKKLAKKGEYFGPTYSIEYTNPRVIFSIGTSLPVKKEDMQSGRFQGFEVVTK
ncbi:MAG: hypothetical protein K6F10_02580 [Paludibacteraceae bacterium]|nr:hypothetical protein [Paludibacteraceae bacterium]